MENNHWFHWLAAANRNVRGVFLRLGSIKSGALRAAVLIPLVSGFSLSFLEPSQDTTTEKKVATTTSGAVPADRLAQETAALAASETELRQVRTCLESERKQGHNACTPNGEMRKKPGMYFSAAQQRDPVVCPRMAELFAAEEILEGQCNEHKQKLTELRRIQEKAHTGVSEEHSTIVQPTAK